MRLPGQLRDTTLGDLLGALFREEADGTLELIETNGHQHRIFLRQGRVEKVESEGNAPLLGELLNLESIPALKSGQRLGAGLLEGGLVDEQQLSVALKHQNYARLEILFELKEANIRFRAPRPRNCEPGTPDLLGEGEVLMGRPRNRERNATVSPPSSCRHEGALLVLGLSSSSSTEDIRHAFRSLAARLHPDRHPHASIRKHLELRSRFAQVSRAYHTLTG